MRGGISKPSNPSRGPMSDEPMPPGSPVRGQRFLRAGRRHIGGCPESPIGLSVLRPLLIAVCLVGSVRRLRFVLVLVVANDGFQRADCECGAFPASDC